MDNSTHLFTQEQCNHQALFLSQISYSNVENLWFALLFLLPFSSLTTGLAANATVQTRKEILQHDDCEITHPSANTNNNVGTTRFSVSDRTALHFFFSTTTLLFGIDIFLFILQCLAVQALHYCTDQSLVATDYVAVWALTGLLGGAAVGSAALFWINALACVGGAKDRVLPWNGFVVVECGLVASPLVVGILVIFVLVKGVVACVGKWTEFFRGGGNNGETRARGTAGDGAEEGELGDMESGNLSRAETEVALETFDKGGS